MLNFIKQLFIEQLLSGAKPYLAFHPELGVPIGVFNYKDEPNRQSRIDSIKKMGKKGGMANLMRGMGGMMPPGGMPPGGFPR